MVKVSANTVRHEPQMCEERARKAASHYYKPNQLQKMKVASRTNTIITIATNGDTVDSGGMWCIHT